MAQVEQTEKRTYLGGDLDQVGAALPTSSGHGRQGRAVGPGGGASSLLWRGREVKGEAPPTERPRPQDGPAQ